MLFVVAIPITDPIPIKLLATCHDFQFSFFNKTPTFSCYPNSYILSNILFVGYKQDRSFKEFTDRYQ